MHNPCEQIHDSSFLKNFFGCRASWWCLIALLACCSAFVGNMHRGLMETTEGRYAECAREMVETGNYLEPTLNYAPHWTKPPLAYWSMATGMKIAGNTEAGARLAGGFAFLGAVLLTALMAWRLWGERAAFFAAAVFVSSLLPVLGATMLSTDILLTWWETLAVAFYVFWAFPGVSKNDLAGQNPSEQNLLGRRADWRTHLCWLAFGLAFLTKGPPALLPLLGLLPWHWWRFRNLRIFSILGLVLFCVCAFGWFALIAWKHPGLLTYYLRDEVVARIATDNFHRNPEWYKPLIIYAPLLLLGSAHWLWLLWRGRINWKQNWQDMARSVRIFILLWFFLPLLVFCLSESRLPLYILPLAVPCTLFLAFFLDRDASMRKQTVLFICATVVCVLCGARWITGWLPLSANMRHLAEAVRQEEAATQVVPLAGFLDPPAYGLQFYTQRKMQWVSRQEGDERTLRAYLVGLKAPERLVTKGKYGKLMSRLCAELHIRMQERQFGKYGIFCLEPNMAKNVLKATGGKVASGSPEARCE